MVRRLFLLLALLAAPALASEAIEDYAVQIWLEPDGSLTVQEDLLTRVENVAIRHGIYRDLLIRPPAASGAAARGDIVYEIVAARLDGAPVHWFTDTRGRTLRVYLGESDRLVPPGLHRFTLRYRVRYAALPAGSRARLDWNLTGNDWRFPILATRLHVYLPPALSAAEVRGRVFYGPLGSGASLPLARTGPRTLAFEYEQTLAPGSGLTLQLEWPAALLKPPAPPLDPTVRILLAGLLVSLALNAASWLRAGRDPRAGPVIPRFEPPPLSAALAAYLVNGGYNTRAFSAAVAELSSRGFLAVSGGEAPVLEKAERPPDERLPRELRYFYNALFNRRRRLALERENAAVLQEAQNALRGELQTEAAPLLRQNGGLLMAGQALTAAILAWLAYRGEHDFALAVFAVFAYLFYVTVAVHLLKKAALAWERYRLIPGLSPLRELLAAALAIAGVLLPPAALALLAGALSGVLTGLLLGLLPLCGALAAYLIPAYTREGARLRNHLLGLARYLGTTDEAALRRIGAPEEVPERLNELFPYAVALGLEAPFGRRLEAFARVRPEEAGRVVVWNRPLTSYGSGGGLAVGDYAASLSTSLRAALARAQTSGGGGGFSGGGFSGGGGGGGGGGGW